MSKNKPEYIIIHHSLTVDGPTLSWEAIRKYHIEKNGWYDIGYHKGIELVEDTVKVFHGRADNVPGAHCKELKMNTRSIGICVVGNYDLIEPSDDHLKILMQLCQAYRVNYEIPIDNVLGHREVGMMAGFDWRKSQFKTCPGKFFSITDFRNMLR